MSRLARRGHLVVRLAPGLELEEIAAHRDVRTSRALPATALDGGGALDRAIRRHSPAMLVSRAFYSRESLGRPGEGHLGFDALEHALGLSRTFRLTLDPDVSVRDLALELLRAGRGGAGLAAVAGGAPLRRRRAGLGPGRLRRGHRRGPGAGGRRRRARPGAGGQRPHPRAGGQRRGHGPPGAGRAAAARPLVGGPAGGGDRRRRGGGERRALAAPERGGRRGPRHHLRRHSQRATASACPGAWRAPRACCRCARCAPPACPAARSPPPSARCRTSTPE